MFLRIIVILADALAWKNFRGVHAEVHVGIVARVWKFEARGSGPIFVQIREASVSFPVFTRCSVQHTGTVSGSLKGQVCQKTGFLSKN